MPSKTEGLKFEYHHMGYRRSLYERTKGTARSPRCTPPTLNAALAAFIAFKVADLDRAIGGKSVLLGPYCPFAGFR
jgi:hypothetical protein